MSRYPSSLVFLILAACSGGSNQAGTSNGGATSNCTAGSERCACYANGTCNQGLECRSNVCVASGSGGGAGGTVAGGGSNALGGTSTTGGTQPAGGTMGNGGATGGTPGSGDAPVILTLSPNVTTLTPNDVLVVTAVVTDPQGIADVIGGTLNDPGGTTYGAFAVSTVSGSYSVTLTWTAINTVRSITTPAGGATRTFQAVFYDQEAHSTTSTFSIQLQCPTTTDAICTGSCKDLQTDSNNCGTCGVACPSTSDYACSSSRCMATATSSTARTCSSICAGTGISPPGTCAAGGATAVYNTVQLSLDCGTVPPASYGGYSLSWVTCQCYV